MALVVKILRNIASFIAIIIVFLVFSAAVFATKPEKPEIPIDKTTGRVFQLPSTAYEVAPGLYSLGKAIDKGRLVEGYAIVDYKKGHGKPGTECGNGICEPGENVNKCPADCGGSTETDSTCYGFIGRGSKWKDIEPYIINPENIRGLKSNYISANFADNIDKWEDAADGSLDGVALDILGQEISGVTDGADTVLPDDKNEVMFADIVDSDAIAVTIIWGIFSGPPFARELVEWDMIFDDITYDWEEDAEGSTTKMDFENIATHELGHSFGLDDLYKVSCGEETMYGLADFGEVKKRTLESGDVKGISELYK